MLAFQPKYVQPFSFEHACQLDAPTIVEEITRLQNSLRALTETQKQLQDAISSEPTPDADLQQAFQENLEVIGSQEERITMLRKALEAQGAAIADNPHYQVQSQAISLPAAVHEAAPVPGVSEQTTNQGDDSEGDTNIASGSESSGVHALQYSVDTSGGSRSKVGTRLQPTTTPILVLAAMSIFDRINLPPLLFNLPRNPVVAVGLPIVLGTLSGYPTAKVVKSNWYEALRAPPGRPPRQTFGIVWPILYASMGYASHLAIKTYDSSLSPAIKDAALTGLKMYWVQLGLNLTWTPLFFLWKKKGLALIDIAALTSTVVAMTRTLHEPTEGVSTYFLAPYCAWLTFATYLNGGYWWLNRGTPSGSMSFPRRGK